MHNDSPELFEATPDEVVKRAQNNLTELAQTKQATDQAFEQARAHYIAALQAFYDSTTQPDDVVAGDA